MAARATLTQAVQLGLATDQIAKYIAVKPAAAQAALDAASARLDAALASQVDVALIIAPYPMDIIECECVLGTWTMLLVAGYNPPQTGTDDNLKARYLEWADYLDKVSKGELHPQVTLSSEGSTPDAGVTGPSVITATQRGYSERGIDRQSPPIINTDPFSGN